MQLYITRHARNRMRLYEINSLEVEKLVRNPETITAGSFGRKHAWKRRADGSWLRVTSKEEGQRRIIITVTPKKEFRGGKDAY